MIILIYEPNQFRMWEKIINSWTDNIQETITIVICDPNFFTSKSYQKLVKGLESKINIEFAIPSEKEFTNFINFNSTKCLSKKILEYEKSLGSNNSLNQVVNSSALFNSYERTPYYKIFNNKKKMAFILLLIKNIKHILSKNNCSGVITYEREYEVKALFKIECYRQKIPFFTIIMSRIGDYNLILQNAAKTNYEVILFSKNQINKHIIDIKKHINHWLEMVNNINTPKENLVSLYGGNAVIDSRFQNKSLITKILTVTNHNIKLINAYIKNSYFQTLKGFYFSGIRYKTFLFLLKMIYRGYANILFDGFTVKNIPQIPYFFFPLHLRPESSSLQLSLNFTDEAIIEILSRAIPPGVILLVKENPSMFYLRRKIFYKNILKKYSNIFFISNEFNTQYIIKNSLGVIGINGTALLEAALLDKPSFSFGSVEFKEIFKFKEPDKIDDFIRFCIRSNGHDKTAKKRALQYIDNNFKSVMPSITNLEKLNNPKILEEISNRILSCFK